MKAEQRAQLRGYPANGLLNDALDLLEEKLLLSYAQHRATGTTPSTEVLRALCQPEVKAPAPSSKPATATKTKSFWDYFAEYIALAKGHGTKGSATAYENTARHVRAFATHAKINVTFEAITPALGDKFTLYLLHQANLTDTPLPNRYRH